MERPTDPATDETGIRFHGISVQMPEIVPHYLKPEGGVNQPCSCGSGRKFRRCHGQRNVRSKPRSQMFEIPLLESAADNELFVRLDPFTMQVSAHGAQGAIPMAPVTIERSYARDKGKKVIAQATSEGDDRFMDFARVLSEYDRCLVVDTNTRHVDGEAVSVTGALLGRTVIDAKGAGRIDVLPWECTEFRGVTCSPEKLGWREALLRYLDSDDFDGARRHCLIVDSHLGEIAEINTRSLPILGTMFLPEGFRIAYATADARDNIHNELLQMADEQSRGIFRLIESNQAVHPLEVAEGEPYGASRRWIPKPYGRSEPTTLRKADGAVPTYHEVIEQPHLHHRQCLLQSIGEHSIRRTRFRRAAGMLMCKYDRSRRVVQGQLHDLARVDARRVQRAHGNVDCIQDLVLGVEEQHPEGFAGEHRHRCREVALDRSRIAELHVAFEVPLDLVPCGSEHLVRRGRAVTVARLPYEQRVRQEGRRIRHGLLRCRADVP